VPVPTDRALALQSSIIGALAVADLVKTSLGPKGMDKILQSSDRGGSVSVTNDGATILKSILIDVRSASPRRITPLPRRARPLLPSPAAAAAPLRATAG